MVLHKLSNRLAKLAIGNNLAIFSIVIVALFCLPTAAVAEVKDTTVAPKPPELATKKTVTSQHLSDDALQKVVDSGAMKNLPDGKFHKEKVVTRAEMAAAVVNLFNVGERKTKNPVTVGNIPDVSPEHWAYNAITTALKHHIMEGYYKEDAKFFPAQPVSRAEGFAIFAQAYGVYPFKQDVVNYILNSYRDHDRIPGWAKAAVATALHDDFVNVIHATDKQKLIQPEQSLTRGDLAFAVYQYIQRQHSPHPIYR